MHSHDDGVSSLQVEAHSACAYAEQEHTALASRVVEIPHLPVTHIPFALTLTHETPMHWHIRNDPHTSDSNALAH